MSSKLSANLNQLMTEARLNAEELSRRIGVPASTIKKVRNNNDANPTLSTLAPLAKYFSLTISELVGDEALPAARMKGSYKVNPETLSYIPLISWQESINWPTANIKSKLTLPTENIYSKQAFALSVEEDNWENLSRGTALFVDPTLKALHRDFVIIHKKGQDIPTLKQVLIDEGILYLKPVTDGYNITTLTEDHTILGVVVEYKKHLKTI